MPVITISRMFGSGGSEVAEFVAQALGWHLFDNEMIDAVAERSGLTRKEVSDQDERVPSMVERLATALSLGSPEIMPPVPSEAIESTEERVVSLTQRVIEEAIHQGPAVFVVPGERRKGVLRALVAAAERWCEEHDITEMRLHNSAASREARHAWTSLGFDVVEEVRRREVRPANPAASRRTPPRRHAEVR